MVCEGDEEDVDWGEVRRWIEMTVGLVFSSSSSLFFSFSVDFFGGDFRLRLGIGIVEWLILFPPAIYLGICQYDFSPQNSSDKNGDRSKRSI